VCVCVCVRAIPPCHLLSKLNDFQEIYYTFCASAGQNITCEVWGSHSSTAEVSSLSVRILLVEWKTKFCSNIHPACEKSSYNNRQSKPVYCKQTNCVSHTSVLKNELKALVQVEESNYWPKHCESSPFFKIYVRNSVTGLSYIPNIFWEYQRL